MIREESLTDKSNMEGSIANFFKECHDARKLGRKVRVQKPEAIVIAGMGGSGISGRLLHNYLPELPIFVANHYDLPEWLPKKTLVFVASYSGNTEETLSMFQAAHKKGYNIVAMSSGGKLEKMANAKNVTHIKLPTGFPPRLATAFLFVPLITVLQNSGIIPNKDVELDKAIQALQNPKHKRMGEDISKRLVDRVPLIYSSKNFSAVAMKWKTDINENAKTPAFHNTYSEHNHNELNGFLNLPARFHVIILRDEDDNRHIQKRFDITKKIIRETGTTVTEIMIRGDNKLSKILSTMHIGLWAAYHLALAYGTDPTPVPVIEVLKRELKK
ncbi:MAG: bifunctional phosphoglucose/phosphomannose isomerase [Nanoarchaeota archaeon]|nr:bifunctional phosphoglucose/phosphomannose isomerase [Nanoarchaeota archaeon]